MLGRSPRLSHRAMRWLIIALLVINGVQIVLLQGAINSSALRHVGETWAYVAASGAALILSGLIILWAFLMQRR